VFEHADAIELVCSRLSDEQRGEEGGSTSKERAPPARSRSDEGIVKPRAWRS
jgi:hypothetical protein